ncbi:hypothetical protein BH10ACT10_BH10ACT10_01150 [soil metagenome]
MFALDLQNRFVYSSEASQAYLGYAPADLLGTRASTLISPDELECIDHELSGRVDGIDTLVLRGRHRNGLDRWLQCTTAPVLDADSRARIGWTGTALLLTEEDHPRIVRELHRRTVTGILADEALETVFQPIADLANGRIVGVEALSRFPSHPELTPEEVFAQAANAGLARRMELLAIEHAFSASQQLSERLYLAVNISPPVLCSPDFIATLRMADIDLTRVVVEITEHVSVEDYNQLQECREALRSLGVKVAIDDAGSGYASLRHILALQPDAIKLDRALVTDVDRDRARQALVAAFVTFAQELGATVIGEGVETIEALRTLQTLGVDAAQGYLIGRPTGHRSEWTEWCHPTDRAAIPGLG